MKKHTKTFLIRTLKIFGIFGIGLLLWIALAVFNIHCRLLTLGMLQMADIYKTAGTISLNTPNGIKTAQIYKQNNKPFLLVGPYRFSEDQEGNDFFFVAKDCVITTVTDKGCEWATLGNYLLINDDMTQWDRVRMPFSCEADKNSGGINFNPQKSQYDFTLNIDNKRPVSFSIPAKYFTADMPNAELFFDGDKIPPPWIIRMFRKVVSQ